MNGNDDFTTESNLEHEKATNNMSQSANIMDTEKVKQAAENGKRGTGPNEAAMISSVSKEIYKGSVAIETLNRLEGTLILRAMFMKSCL